MFEIKKAKNFLKYIDAIAREKQHDVIWLKFSTALFHFRDKEGLNNIRIQRDKIINWLNSNNIEWEECGEIADESSITEVYFGQIFIDILPENKNVHFQRLQRYLKNDSGFMKTEFKDAKLLVLPLEKAMQNAHHDEPGFWEKWAEDF